MSEALRQQALVEAIASGRLPPALVGQTRGLQAYRAHAQVLAAQSLAAIFPRLRQLLGEPEFEAMAWAFWRAAPPRHGDLGRWGQDLPDFLQARTGDDGLPPDCARLEWAAHAAERAADVELDGGSLPALADGDPARLWLRLRPGLCVLDLQPQAAALWPLELVPTADRVAVLVWRPQWRAQACVLSAEQAFFMSALSAGQSLGRALESTLAAHASFDFAAWLQAALARAWLWQVSGQAPQDKES